MEFVPLKNDLLLRAALRQPTERSPVWIMRQAGRYLPEFRELRKKHDFFEICRTPALACEITLQPIDRYSGLLDAAIIFSDILVIPQAMGMIVEMLPGSGPHFPNPISSTQDAHTLLEKHIDVAKELGYVYQAITLTRQKLNGRVPLIGFCGAPWTLLAYMVEGGGSKTFAKAKRWLYDEPALCHQLLQKIAEVAADFLVGQIQAGAQLVQVFDSWAGELTPAHFRSFSLPYLKLIATRVRTSLSTSSSQAVPMTIFAKGALGHSMHLLVDIGYDVVGLDWTVDPAWAREQASGKVALQGNADPSLLYASPAAIDAEVQRMCEGFGLLEEGGHIANLGHGITPEVDPEHLRCFLEAVHKHSRRGS